MLWRLWLLVVPDGRTKQASKGQGHLLSCCGQLKTQDFCTKMKFPPFYMIFRGAGAGQHYLVGFISLLSPQARGASVMSLLFQSVRKGICDEYMAIWGLRLRSYPAIFTGQGQINKVIPVSECLYLVNFKILKKVWNFWKLSGFRKIFRFREIFQISGNFSDFRKIFRFPENF